MKRKVVPLFPHIIIVHDHLPSSFTSAQPLPLIPLYLTVVLMVDKIKLPYSFSHRYNKFYKIQYYEEFLSIPTHPVLSIQGRALDSVFVMPES